MVIMDARHLMTGSRSAVDRLVRAHREADRIPQADKLSRQEQIKTLRPFRPNRHHGRTFSVQLFSSPEKPDRGKRKPSSPAGWDRCPQ